MRKVLHLHLHGAGFRGRRSPAVCMRGDPSPRPPMDTCVRDPRPGFVGAEKSVSQVHGLVQIDMVPSRRDIGQLGRKIVRGEEAPEHADGHLERVDVLDLVVGQLPADPFARVGQTRRQVHDHQSVEAVDDDPSQAIGAHLRARLRDWVETILA